jgi:hypothetical protein
MPLLQFIGMLCLLGTVVITIFAGVLWLRSRWRVWGWIAVGTPATYLLLLLMATAIRDQETLPPGTPQRFCGFYIDCHLSVAVTHVERTPSAWEVTLRLASDAREVALAPAGLTVELMRGDSTVRLVPDATDLGTPIAAGASREFKVAFAAPPEGETPTLRVTEGIGVDRVIEGVLLGDDDALGRVRVKLGL